MTRFTMLGTALAVALLASLPAARAADAAQTDRMTDLLVQAVPMGRIFETLAATDPNWPVQDRPDAVAPAQRDCLRSELSTAGYRRAKREEVAAYLAGNPEGVSEDLEALASGGPLLGEMMLAGAESERTGTPPDQEAILAKAAPGQMQAFVAIMSEPEHAGLRRLAGFGDVFSVEKSTEQNEKSGEQAGMNLAMRFMQRAMKTCKVDPSVFD